MKLENMSIEDILNSIIEKELSDNPFIIDLPVGSTEYKVHLNLIKDNLIKKYLVD